MPPAGGSAQSRPGQMARAPTPGPGPLTGRSVGLHIVASHRRPGPGRRRAFKFKPDSEPRLLGLSPESASLNVTADGADVTVTRTGQAS